jgi:hypothetical protein
MAIIVSDVGEGISANEVVRRVRRLLTDQDSDTWDDPTLIDWINDAGTAIVKLLPSSRYVLDGFALQAGSKQVITSDRAVSLHDITRNLSGNQRAITVVERQLLDDLEPNWHSKDPSGEVLHYSFDERAPLHFYVYPPAVAETLVEIMYSEAPPLIDDVNDALTINQKYIDAMVNYVMYRSLSEESEDGAPGLSIGYYQAFKDCLGIEANSQVQVTPNEASV